MPSRLPTPRLAVPGLASPGLATPRLATRRLATRRLAVWCAAALAALPAGCGPKADDFAPPCPTLRLLRDAGDITRFGAQGQDVTDMLVSARIAAVPALCAAGPRGFVKATLSVSMQLTRGPALQGRTVQIPYFVSIVEGDRILEQRDYVLAASFLPNADHQNITSDPIEMMFPVSADRNATAYTIYVAFRLTPEELDYNRHNAAR